MVDVNGVKIGGSAPIAVMAGPCSIEGEAHTIAMAQAVKAGGANFLRGGAYKPRTSPYSFQGLGTEGILDMVKARELTGLPIVSELMDEAILMSLSSMSMSCRSAHAICRTSSC